MKRSSFRTFLKFQFLAAIYLFSIGCLKTRSDVQEGEQRHVMQDQVTTLQQKNADSATKLSDVEESLREVSGRVVSLEHRMQTQNQNDQGAAKLALEQNQALNQRVDALQEELTKMSAQIAGLQGEVTSMKAEGTSKTVKASSKANKKDLYEESEALYQKKEWKKAAISFQKFREQNPKGSKGAEATYKIGMSFQELGMKDEAKAFFEEVIEKHPKSEEAKKAKAKLKK